MVSMFASRVFRGVSGRVLLILSALSAVFAFSALSAQTDPRLVEVIRHAQEGEGDSARIKVERLLAVTSPSDTLYPQIVYTQAMVASDAADMRRQLQRVAVEHSASSWADDALLRLVQLDYASANLDGAARHLERLRLDYPGSPLLPQASYWAARTYFDQKRPELACRWIADGMSGTSNVELQNQLRYLNQRCTQLASAGAQVPKDTAAGVPVPAESPPRTAGAPRDTSAPAATRDSAPPVPTTTQTATPIPPARAPGEPVASRDTLAAPAPGPTRYRIQITAVRSLTTARSTAGRLKSRGFDVVTVEEGGLYKVRVGEYPTKAEAIAALPDIKAKLGGSPFVVAES